MQTLAIYYVDPIQRRRRKLVRLRPSEEEITHYLAIGGQCERVRCIGVYGFREEIDGGYSEPFDDIIRPSGVRTIRVEEFATAEQIELEVTG